MRAFSLHIAHSIMLYYTNKVPFLRVYSYLAVKGDLFFRLLRIISNTYDCVDNSSSKVNVSGKDIPVRSRNYVFDHVDFSRYSFHIKIPSSEQQRCL